MRGRFAWAQKGEKWQIQKCEHGKDVQKIWQVNNTNPYLPITKKLEHCDSPEGSKELYVSLTADETMRFTDKYKGKIQMRGQCSTDGTIFGNRTQLFTVYPMKDEILDEDPTLPPENEDGWIIFDGEAISDS